MPSSPSSALHGLEPLERCFFCLLDATPRRTITLLDSVFSDETLSHLEDLAVDRFHGWRDSCEYSNALAKVDAVISELVVTCICGECSRPYQFIREFLLFLTLDETLSSYPRTRFVWLVALWRQEIIANKTLK